MAERHSLEVAKAVKEGLSKGGVAADKGSKVEVNKNEVKKKDGKVGDTSKEAAVIEESK
jgi:hypothetical protein